METKGKRSVVVVCLLAGAVVGFAVVAVMQSGPAVGSEEVTPLVNATSAANGGPGTESQSGLGSNGGLAERSRATSAREPVASESGEPLLVPITDETPISRFTLGAVKASMVAASGEVPIEQSNDEFAEVALADAAPVAVRFRLPQTQAGSRVRINAPEGGKITRQGGPMEFLADGSPVDLNLTFEPTLGGGSYMVAVSHGGDTATLHFWVGGRAPRGEPGPAFVPLPPDPTLSALPQS